MTQNQDLRAELLCRFERDQAARGAAGAAQLEAMTRVDAENLPWLKQVIAEIGWPGESDVGVDGAHAAWLLAQHADADPQFQRRCLDLLIVAAEQGEATKVEVAYLTDRVLLAEGKPQEFGTQATGENGRWVPRRLRDPDTVDQRRAAVPLEPMADYLARMTDLYGPNQAGYQTADLRRVVLTHFHPDHIGAAADIAGWGEIEVLAHQADAPFIRAEAVGPPPDLADWERPLYDQVTSQVTRPATREKAAEPPAPPRIDRELSDGDELGFGDGAVAVAVPGHTPGSVAIYLPRHQVLFAGDAAARTPDGTVICGVFNVNRGQAASSFRQLAVLSVDVACFGHGEPLVHDATAALRAAAQRLPAGTGHRHSGPGR
jgi:glyoxylase-like metal-dependent hydrolase (beta-lactamase superfamily II)